MMELDDLKAGWQRETEKNLELNKKSMEQLRLMLAEKSAGALTVIKKKYEKIISLLLGGILLQILVNPFLHFLLGDEGPVFRITFGGLVSMATVVVLGLVVILFYWLKYTGLKTTIPATNLKGSLITNIAGLQKSMRQEIIFIISLFLILFMSARFSSEYLGHGSFWDIGHPDILLSLLTAVLLFGFYTLKRVVFYKRHIRELQQYLAEFNEQPGF